ncbi:MAG: alpha/beta fold hydrolase [Piscinibacter sp.]|uniref:alpha/beta fold hydrolase n=1 Tax=Piscinibacter sp. TaxID=1903157 RepID=UPI003D135C72
MSRHANPTTVLLPGLACDAELWREQLRALGPRHAPRVADVHTRAPTLPEMASLLLAEQPGELVLIGASMGGRIALEAARQAPGRVRALALLGSTARADTDELRAVRSEAVAHFDAGHGDDLLEANVWFVFHRSAWDDEALIDRYRAMLRRTGFAQLARQNRAIMSAADMRPSLRSIACPTLVVCGENDDVTPPECSREMAESIPGSRLAFLPDCGHMLTMEKPAAVNQLLLDWLASLEPEHAALGAG